MGRHYAWMSTRHLGKTPTEAEAPAFYVYREPGTPNRGLVFHDRAWHWPLLVMSDFYWRTHPELASPGDECFDVE